MAGARELTVEVIKEWFKYFFQCTECRRCAVFCPYGIDTAEFTMLGRDLLLRLGLSANWVMELWPIATAPAITRHPTARIKDSLEFMRTSSKA